jgi:hypothetical protein
MRGNRRGVIMVLGNLACFPRRSSQVRVLSRPPSPHCHSDPEMTLGLLDFKFLADERSVACTAC